MLARLQRQIADVQQQNRDEERKSSQLQQQLRDGDSRRLDVQQKNAELELKAEELKLAQLQQRNAQLGQQLRDGDAIELDRRQRNAELWIRWVNALPPSGTAAGPTATGGAAPTFASASVGDEDDLYS